MSRLAHQHFAHRLEDAKFYLTQIYGIHEEEYETSLPELVLTYEDSELPPNVNGDHLLLWSCDNSSKLLLKMPLNRKRCETAIDESIVLWIAYQLEGDATKDITEDYLQEISRDFSQYSRKFKEYDPNNPPMDVILLEANNVWLESILNSVNAMNMELEERITGERRNGKTTE